jgi:hypothetical protein
MTIGMRVMHIDDHLVAAKGSKRGSDNFRNLADGLDVSNDSIFYPALEGVSCEYVYKPSATHLLYARISRLFWRISRLWD